MCTRLVSAHHTHFLAWQGVPQTAPVAGFVYTIRCVSAHPSHIPWPHGELHRRKARMNGRVRVRYPVCFCTPLTHCLAPWGAPQKAPATKLVCGTQPSPREGLIQSRILY